MGSVELGKIITVFIACFIKPGMIGIPTAVFAFQFTFLKALLVCSTGGITGTFVFTFLLEAIGKLWTRGLDKFFPNRNKGKVKKVFTRRTRFILKTKKNFGIPGIAIISPPFISLPIGIFFALRFFGDRQKILLWFSVSNIAWTIVLYFVYNFFYDTLVTFFT